MARSGKLVFWSGEAPPPTPLASEAYLGDGQLGKIDIIVTQIYITSLDKSGTVDHPLS